MIGSHGEERGEERACHDYTILLIVTSTTVVSYLLIVLLEQQLVYKYINY